MNKTLVGLLIAAVLGLFLITETFYTITPTTQGLVLQFGEPKRTVKEPGLHLKIPFIETLQIYDKRILAHTTPPEQIISSDKGRLVVDAYTRYIIEDPLQFYQRLTNETQAKVRLSAMITSSLRGILGQTSFEEMLSENRHEIMAKVQKDVAKSVESMGIKIIDVRIRRVDLPEQNSQAVFKRMESERARIAKKKRALGRQRGEEIRANADREKAIILANADKDAKISRGEGEGKSAKIYADAYAKDKNFFEFYRSLQAYEKSLKPENTSYILSPDSGDFLNTFKNSK
tara:strand:+ start:7404 stop:8267 length:864 start_codon:yes stop_codon:yes gene_type:complete